MASATAAAPAIAPSTSLPAGRLAGIGLIIFLANAALLVLQLVASRLLAPFVGSSLETWTSIIGVFLVGIALGNAYGGRIADRYPSPRTLAILLAVGAAAALWMVIFPLGLASASAYKSIPLGPRIPLLALVLCLPSGFVLSLLTPLAIRLGLPDVSRTGRVAGLVFALSTLGCLIGNYLTGFVLIPAFTINTLVFFAAGALAILSVVTLCFLKSPLSPGGVGLNPRRRRDSALRESSCLPRHPTGPRHRLPRELLRHDSGVDRVARAGAVPRRVALHLDRDHWRDAGWHRPGELHRRAFRGPCEPAGRNARAAGVSDRDHRLRARLRLHRQALAVG